MTHSTWRYGATTTIVAALLAGALSGAPAHAEPDAPRSAPAAESGRGDSPEDAPPARRQKAGSAARSVNQPGETTKPQSNDGSVVYRVSDGHALDQYLFRGDLPLTWTMDVSDGYGPVDGEGHPAPGNELYGKSVLLTVRTYDVDSDSGEVDHLYVNGTRVGEKLTGASDQWSTNTFDVPADVLRLPTAGNATGTNEFMIDIDVLNDGWAVQVDWAELRTRSAPVLPMAFVHGIASDGSAMSQVETAFVLNEPKLLDRTIKPETTKTGSTVKNAQLLEADVYDLLRGVPTKKVDIVAHSKGGLDSRVMAVRNPGLVRNLVMIATPNGGSELANIVCSSELVANQFKQFGKCDSAEAGIYQLQTEFVRDIFNKQVKDLPSTSYYTVAGTKAFSGAESASSSILSGQDDGATSVDSVTWLDSKSPGSKVAGGRHVNLSKTIYENHNELIKLGSPAVRLAVEKILGTTARSTTAQRAERPAPSAARDLGTELADGDLVAAGGVADNVPAGQTRTFPLAVTAGEDAVLLLVKDDSLVTTVGGVPGTATELLGSAATEYSFTGPQTLTVKNTGTAEASFIGYLMVDSVRALTLDVPTVTPLGTPARIAATLSGAVPGDAVTYVVRDADGDEVASGSLDPEDDDIWSTELLLSDAGSYSVSAAVAGPQPRVANSPHQVTAGGEIQEGTSEVLLDDDADGRADSLEVTVPVDVDEAGTYFLGGNITDESGDVVAEGHSDPTDLEAGAGEITVSFAGRDLGNSGASAPWRLSDLLLTDVDLTAKDHADDLGEIGYSGSSWYELDALAVKGITDSPRDTDDDETLDVLDIDVDVDVALPGYYAVNGRLVAPDGTEVARAQADRDLSDGSQSVRLSFSAADIQASGLNGPYTLRDFSIYPIYENSDGVSLVDAHTTRAYGFADLHQLSLQPAGDLAVTGDAVVGSTLAISSQPDWPAATTTSLQWLRDGEPIDEAVDDSYVLTPDDLDAEVSVRLTARASGYDDTDVVSEPLTVGKGTLATTGVLAIGGTAKVGEVLTIGSRPTWSPAGATTTAWLRDGAAIPNATDASYRLVDADLGRSVSVRLTTVAPGYRDSHVTSDPQTVAPRIIAGSGLPAISGTARLGGRLNAALPGWTADDTAVSYQFQWLRNGAEIAGATASTYRPVFADVGRTLSVRVTGRAPSAPSRVGTSGAVAIKKIRPRASAKGTTAHRKVQLRVAVKAAGVPARDVQGRVVVRLGKRIVGRGTVRAGKVTLKLRRQAPGRRTYRITFAATRAFSPASTTVKIRVKK